MQQGLARTKSPKLRLRAKRPSMRQTPIAVRITEPPARCTRAISTGSLGFWSIDIGVKVPSECKTSSRESPAQYRNHQSAKYDNAQEAGPLSPTKQAYSEHTPGRYRSGTYSRCEESIKMGKYIRQAGVPHGT